MRWKDLVCSNINRNFLTISRNLEERITSSLFWKLIYLSSLMVDTEGKEGKTCASYFLSLSQFFLFIVLMDSLSKLVCHHDCNCALTHCQNDLVKVTVKALVVFKRTVTVYKVVCFGNQHRNLVATHVIEWMCHLVSSAWSETNVCDLVLFLWSLLFLFYYFYFYIYYYYYFIMSFIIAILYV